MNDRLVVSPEEVEAVSLLDGEARYSYFIKRVVDWQVAWGLWDDGWVLTREGPRALPCWPALEYARAFAQEGQAPRSIPMADLVEGTLAPLQTDLTTVSVFPTPRDPGFEVEQERLSGDLRSYEDEWYR